MWCCPWRGANTIRIPNGALAFRPPPDLLAAIGEVEPRPASRRAGRHAVRAVWEYDGRQFTPIAFARASPTKGGPSSSSGSIRPGDELVTGAVLQRRHRL
jgi:hypothetical protein